MRPLSAAETLSIWERGAVRRPVDRAALLAARARPDVAPEDVAALPLGAVTRALLALRIATFGPAAAGVADCAACGERLDLDLDVAALLDGLPPPAGDIAVAGWRVRPPGLADLAAIDGETDTARAVRRLLDRCTLAAGEAPLDPAILAAIEAALDAHDPAADLAIAVACPLCGEETLADLDVGALFWEEIAVSARLLLGEVHRLARAYGWSEAEILGLGPARRAAYLALVDE